MDPVFHRLLEFAEAQAALNTHSHHLDDGVFVNYSLDKLLQRSYVSWCGAEPGGSAESRRAYLDKVRFKSYFVWLQKALQSIYGFAEPISAENWEQVSGLIACRHGSDKSFHLDILKSNCRYERVIRDTYWKSNSNHDHPEVFSPTFRINMFLYGSDAQSSDHNGDNAARIYDRAISDVDEYAAFMREIVRRKKSQGTVALKCASAYDRGIDFEETTREAAQKAFNRDKSQVTAGDVKAFQDYVFFELCKIAAEEKLPFQIHTGLGKLDSSNALNLRAAIVKNPQTRFVIFHGSYPWVDDVCGLLHCYPNVYPDLCWLPLISPTAAERALNEFIEVGMADKICWGCDCHAPEESFGALLAIRFVLARVLTEKIRSGYFGAADAEAIIENILSRNARKLYTGFQTSR